LAKAVLISVGIIRDAILEGTGKDDDGRVLNRILGLAPDIQKRIFWGFNYSVHIND